MGMAIVATEQDKAAIAQIMRDLQVSQPTAEFIIKYRSIPGNVSNYPENTPDEDLINIKINTLKIDRDEAEMLVGLESGQILESIVTAENVNV